MFSPPVLRGRRLANVLALVYDAAMELLRSGDKEAVRFVTPSGVTAVVATSVSDAALAKLIRKLERKLRRSGMSPDGSALPAAHSSKPSTR